MTYDAILLAGFGGPRRPEDVVPFLRNVTAGKNIPDARLAQVGEHYGMFGGRSPINDKTQELRDALQASLHERGIALPVVIGNRNWDPYTVDALRQIADAGGRSVLALITAAYSSYSGCRQYREDIAAQAATVGGLRIDQVRAYFNTPGFVQANADAAQAALLQLTGGGYAAGEIELVFVTHSIPLAMEAASGVARPASYVGQHEEVARLVRDAVARASGAQLPSRLVYCSRSGPPQVPWLEPDVNDALADIAQSGRKAVVVAPIGFIADHMEVVYDLDTEAARTAHDLGLGFVRAATVGTHPAFVASLVDAVCERLDGRPAAVVGALPAWEARCAEHCCASGRPSGAGHYGKPEATKEAR